LKKNYSIDLWAKSISILRATTYSWPCTKSDLHLHIIPWM